MISLYASQFCVSLVIKPERTVAKELISMKELFSSSLILSFRISNANYAVCNIMLTKNRCLYE